MSGFVDGITRTKKRPSDFGVPVPVRVWKPELNVEAPDGNKPLLNRLGLKLAFQFLAGFVLAFGLMIAAFQNQTIAQGVDLYRLVKDGRYLVIFQNNTELRPSGGFIGSFAIATIQNKKLADFKIETNIYHKDDQFIHNFYVPQPKPIEDWLSGKSWSLHDSNWEADFAAACQDIKWFYETEYGKQVDGVIAINATVLTDILGLSGPVKLDKYNLVLDQSNALAVLQKQIDLDYYKSTTGLKQDQPKIILAELFPILKLKIDKISKIKLANLIRREIEQKDILFNFDDARQGIVETNNWGGKIDQTAANYLYINNGNLGGGKSSLATAQTVEYRLDGANLELTIQRENLPRADGFKTHTNFNYTRVYLPKGSRLMSWRGENEKGEPITQIDKSVEFNRNVFGFWFNTPLYDKKVVKLNFQLPAFEADKNLLIQKQPGAKNETISVIIDGNKIFKGGLAKDKVLKVRN